MSALRPTVEREIAAPSPTVIARLAELLAGGPHELRRARIPGGGVDSGSRERDHFVLVIPAAERRVWSPWMTVDVSPSAAGTHVFARLGPHPSVWTGYAFAYLILGASGAVSLVIALSAMLVPGHGQGWAGWLAGALALAIAGLWGVAKAGQSLARAQMQALRDQLDAALARLDDVTR